MSDPAEDRSVRGNTLRPDTVAAQNDVTVPDNQGGTISVSTLAQAIPTGGIIMWSGAINDIPDGWTLCDGTNGAPDLRNRFVTGAGDQYSVDDTGGEKKHQLTEDELPSHSHSTDGNTGTISDVQSGGSGTTNVSDTTDATIGSTGNDESHENRPPYYALAYIQKT